MDQPEPASSPKDASVSRLPKYFYPVVIILLIVALVGVYIWQHNQVKDLTGQVASLSAQVAQQSKKTAAENTASSQSSSNTTPVSTAPVPCKSSSVNLTMGQPNGAAGTSYINAVITNKSSVACTVAGFPKVVLADASNQALGQQATQSGSASSTVTLQPGGTAHTSLGFPSAGNFDPGACSANSTYLNLTLPGDSTALQTALGQQYCPGFSTTAFSSGSSS